MSAPVTATVLEPVPHRRFKQPDLYGRYKRKSARPALTAPPCADSSSSSAVAGSTADCSGSSLAQSQRVEEEVAQTKLNTVACRDESLTGDRLRWEKDSDRLLEQRDDSPQCTSSTIGKLEQPAKVPDIAPKPTAEEYDDLLDMQNPDEIPVSTFPKKRLQRTKEVRAKRRKLTDESDSAAKEGKATRAEASKAEKNQSAPRKRGSDEDNEMDNKEDKNWVRLNKGSGTKRSDEAENVSTYSTMEEKEKEHQKAMNANSSSQPDSTSELPSVELISESIAAEQSVMSPDQLTVDDILPEELRELLEKYDLNELISQVVDGYPADRPLDSEGSESLSTTPQGWESLYSSSIDSIPYAFSSASTNATGSIPMAHDHGPLSDHSGVSATPLVPPRVPRDLKSNKTEYYRFITSFVQYLEAKQRASGNVGHSNHPFTLKFKNRPMRITQAPSRSHQPLDANCKSSVPVEPVSGAPGHSSQSTAPSQWNSMGPCDPPTTTASLPPQPSDSSFRSLTDYLERHAQPTLSGGTPSPLSDIFGAPFDLDPLAEYQPRSDVVSGGDQNSQIVYTNADSGDSTQTIGSAYFPAYSPGAFSPVSPMFVTQGSPQLFNELTSPYAPEASTSSVLSSRGQSYGYGVGTAEANPADFITFEDNNSPYYTPTTVPQSAPGGDATPSVATTPTITTHMDDDGNTRTAGDISTQVQYTICDTHILPTEHEYESDRDHMGIGCFERDDLSQRASSQDERRSDSSSIDSRQECDWRESTRGEVALNVESREAVPDPDQSVMQAKDSNTYLVENQTMHLGSEWLQDSSQLERRNPPLPPSAGPSVNEVPVIEASSRRVMDHHGKQELPHYGSHGAAQPSPHGITLLTSPCLPLSPGGTPSPNSGYSTHPVGRMYVTLRKGDQTLPVRVSKHLTFSKLKRLGMEHWGLLHVKSPRAVRLYDEQGALVLGSALVQDEATHDECFTFRELE